MQDDALQDDALQDASFDSGAPERLSAPFADGDLVWRVLEREQARVRLAARPSPRALLTRLDAAFGTFGWSSHYQLHDAALCCELRVGAASRSVVRGWDDADTPEQLAHAALVEAALQFGLSLPEDVWQDADGDVDAPVPASAESPQEPDKSAGQQAIDRLLERLRDEGQGLEAARLITQYHGYGADREAARELYGQLRALLRGEAKPSA